MCRLAKKPPMHFQIQANVLSRHLPDNAQVMGIFVRGLEKGPDWRIL